MAPRRGRQSNTPYVVPGKTEVWDGIVKGDPVHVKAYGERGATWRFMYAVERDGRPTEVTVYGGAKGFGSTRTFFADRIAKFSKKVVSTRRKDMSA